MPVTHAHLSAKIQGQHSPSLPKLNVVWVTNVLGCREQLSLGHRVFALPHLEEIPHEYSFLILQHHLLFRKSRWEGWSGAGGSWMGRGCGRRGSKSVCVCVCVCVLGLRMIKEWGNPPSLAHFQPPLISWMEKCGSAEAEEEEEKDKARKGEHSTPPPPPHTLLTPAHLWLSRAPYINTACCEWKT